MTATSMKDEPEHCSFCVLSKDDKTFPDLLNALKKQPDTSLATAPVITWAFADNAGLESQSLDGVYIESFVHASTSIRLGLLKRVLPENQMTDAGEIMQATFEEVPPDPGNDYIFSPTIKKFLDETSLDLLTVDKQKRENYREEEWSKTCFGCRTIRYSSFEQVAKVRSANVAHRQEATLNSTSVKTVAFAAPAHESAAANILVCRSRFLCTRVERRSTRQRQAIQARSQHPKATQGDHAGPASERRTGPPASAALAGQRPRVDLADPSGVSPKKAGRKQGWRKPRPSTPPKPPEGMPWRRGALSALPMPPLPHALAQISAQRKQAGAASPAPAAGEPLALQRLRRVVSTREPDPRPPPRWIPWRRQLHRHLCARVGSF